MNKIIRNILLIILTIVLIPTAKAATTCDYKFRAEVGKIAKNVSVSYEVKTDDQGNEYFAFSIYNVVDGIYVTASSEGDQLGNVSFNAFPEDADENGIYSFITYNTYDIMKYNFKIYSLNSECTSSLRSFSITKPMYNKFSELEECKFYGVEDYFYCQKWITSSINLSETAVKEKIENQRKNNNKTVTTKCISCEENAEISAKLARFNKIKKYIIIGLSIGIVVDIAFIIFLIIRIKRDTI